MHNRDAKRFGGQNNAPQMYPDRIGFSRVRGEQIRVIAKRTDRNTSRLHNLLNTPAVLVRERIDVDVGYASVSPLSASHGPAHHFDARIADRACETDTSSNE